MLTAATLDIAIRASFAEELHGRAYTKPVTNITVNIHF